MSEVLRLAREIERRGLTTFVDVSDPELISGGNQFEEIRRVIKEKCESFVLYVTENVIESPTIMNVEIPAAFEAYDHGGYDFLPVFRSLSPSASKETIRLHGLRIHALGGVVVEHGSTETPHDAISAAHIEAAAILLRRHVERNTIPDTPLVLWPKTRLTGPPLTVQDLTLDWVDNFSGPSPGAMALETYGALVDVSKALADIGHRRVRFTGPSHLSAGLAAGYVFRRVTGFQVETYHEGSWWETEGPSDAANLDVSSEQLDPASQDIGLIVGISRPEIVDDATNAIIDMAIPVAGRIVVRPERAGPGAVRSPEHARGIVREVLARLMTARTTWGARGFLHLFISAPLSLAVMIGRSLNAFGPIRLYEPMDAGRRYVRVLTLNGP